MVASARNDAGAASSVGSISASADWAHRADGRRTAMKGRNSRRFINLASAGRDS